MLVEATLAANIIIILSIISALIFTLEIYQITKAKSLIWLMSGMGYTLVWRLLLTFAEVDKIGGFLQVHATWFILPLWPLMAIGMWGLMEAVRRPFTKDDK